MAVGILREGFVIQNHKYQVRIPKNTVVFFSNNGVPTIRFRDYPITLMRIDGRWYAEFYGSLMLVDFDPNNPPYPIAYFKN